MILSPCLSICLYENRHSMKLGILFGHDLNSNLSFSLSLNSHLGLNPKLKGLYLSLRWSLRFFINTGPRLNKYFVKLLVKNTGPRLNKYFVKLLV